MKIKHTIFTIVAFFIFQGCQNYNYDGPGKDVPTAGKIEIYADRSDSLLITEWLEMFHLNYPKAEIKPIYASHNQLMKWLETDTLKKAFILNEFLTSDQKEYVAKNRNCTAHETHLAQSSVAIILHKQHPLAEISIENLNKCLFTAENNVLNIDQLVADSWGAPIVHLSKLAKQTFKSIKQNFRIKKIHFQNDQDIINYVSQNSNAIGIIALNHLGNNYSKLSLENQKKVKILKVKMREQDIISFYPFQSQIKAKQYPLIQNIVAYDLQGYSGLANGFITFVNSQPGQIMTKKNGLIPMNDVGRTIELGTE